MNPNAADVLTVIERSLLNILRDKWNAGEEYKHEAAGGVVRLIERLVARVEKLESLAIRYCRSMRPDHREALEVALGIREPRDPEQIKRLGLEEGP